MGGYEEYKYYLKVDHYRNFDREKSSFSFKLRNDKYKLLFLFRSCQFLKRNIKKSYLRRKFFKFLEKRYNYYQIKLGIELPADVKIGKGLFIPHPNGIVINSKAEIGDYCTILQQVTIGNNGFKGLEKLAKIGDNTTIGAGAKIIGPCQIGNNVNIGANSVVIKNIEDNSVVGGIPAKLLSRKTSVIHNEYKK